MYDSRSVLAQSMHDFYVVFIIYSSVLSSLLSILWDVQGCVYRKTSSKHDLCCLWLAFMDHTRSL